MKSKLALVMILLLALPAVSVLASGQSGKSNVYQLYLAQKDYNDPTWPVIEDGAWGKLTFKYDGDPNKVVDAKYVFNGHLLTPGVSYTLVNFARVDSEWPMTVHTLDSAVADEYGNVHITGYYTEVLGADTTIITSGAIKFWLVPSYQVVSEHINVWAPSEILFDVDLM